MEDADPATLARQVVPPGVCGELEPFKLLQSEHGISQSTKLCFFEEVMARQMADAKDVPRRLAMTGNLGMKREEVFRILGRLFKSRVEVNLCERHYCTILSGKDALLTTLIYSFKHARRPELLLGERAKLVSALYRSARIPRNQAAYPSTQRALSRLPRSSRDSLRLDCR